MLKHCVFVSFKPDVSEADRTRILSGFGELVPEIDGMEEYVWGPNRDFEKKSGQYGFGFVVTFRDRASHLSYEEHPKHRVLGAELVSSCVGGHEGIVVFDIESGGAE